MSKLIQETRIAIYGLSVALRDFVLAYEEQAPEQLLGAYHQATEAIQKYDEAQAMLGAHLRERIALGDE